MDCKHVNDHLIDYLYQELAPDQMDRIEGHIKGCEGCTAEIAAFESTRSAMRSLPELEPPPALAQVLLREAARAVQPAPEASFWERLREGMRMMVMHPAMTAAVLLVVVVGISFVAYRQGGPPSLEPRADDLPPVPPATVTTEIVRGGPAGAAAEQAAEPQQLKEEGRGRDEVGGLRIADNNKQAELNQAAKGLEGEFQPEGKTTATRELGKAGPAPRPTPVAAAEPTPTPNGYKDQPRADKLDDLIDGAVGGRARPRRPVARRSAADPGYHQGLIRGKAEPVAKSAAPRRSLGNMNDDEDALAGGDFWGQKKNAQGLGTTGSLASGADRSGSAGGGKSAGSYAKAPPPQAKPRAGKPPAAKPPAAKPRPQFAAKFKSTPAATPAPEAAVQAQTAPAQPATSTSTSTPQAIKAPKGTSAAQDAAQWVARGDAASNAGRCEQALAYYNRALGLQLSLRKRVAGRVDRCVKVLGQDGEARLARGAKEYPALAGWFSAEVSRQQKARANSEAGAPYNGSAKASKRKARQAKPAKKAKQAPAAK